MTLKKEASEFTFRKEEFPYIYQYYLCEDTKEQFTTTELDGASINQVYNQYRLKYNIPFPEEIEAIREKYDLSARKMAEILGFGVNVYRNYEQGEVPNLSNAKLIRLAENPNQFKILVDINTSLKIKKQQQLLDKIDELTKKEVLPSFHPFKFPIINDHQSPNQINGYKKLNLSKLAAVAHYFAQHLQPWKTQMNKLLFYCDFLRYKQSGYSITGVPYRAIKMGPVPKNYDLLYDCLAENNLVRIETTAFPNGAIGEQFFPIDSTIETGILSDNELNILDQVKAKFKNYKTQQIIDYSHQEKAWLENYEEKNLINYQYAFDIEFK